MVAKHFTQQCPNLEYLKVTPVEKIQRTIPEIYCLFGQIDKADEIHLFQREQYWMKKLNSLYPFGLNKRQEIPPPIPFIITFNDQTPDITRLVKFIYEKIQERNGHIFWKQQIVTSFKRNKNLKELLVKAKLD